MRSLARRNNPRRTGLRLAFAAGAELMVIAPERSAADPARQLTYGRHLAQECTTCHRLDGIDNGIPSIVGWEVATFRQTLAYYKDGHRANPAMVSVAGSLDAEQIDALAAYYASLPKPKPKAGTDRAGKR